MWLEREGILGWGKVGKREEGLDGAGHRAKQGWRLAEDTPAYHVPPDAEI